MIFLDPYRKYFDFSGRASRKEFWLFSLFCLIVFFLLSILFNDGPELLNDGAEFHPIPSIFILISIIPSYSVMVRRFHDVNRSGWNYFWAFTGIGYIYILYLECKKGDVGYNRFGKPPLALDDNLLKENYNTQNGGEDYNNFKKTDEKIIQEKSKQTAKEPRHIKKNAQDIQDQLKKIDDLFKKSQITATEKKKMRNKVLGID